MEDHLAAEIDKCPTHCDNGDVVHVQILQPGDHLVTGSFLPEYLEHPMHDKEVKSCNIVSV